ncbi:MAG: mechanosensitive ion channel [Saprospiraceae bacterium]|nr:mechanosensitive ion channel [Saprospiraceae bacterium]
MDQLLDRLERWLQTAYDYAPRLIMALVVLILGWIVITWVVGTVSRMMRKRNVDVEIQPFLRSLLSVLLKVLLIFSVAEMVGIRTASFIALLAAAGFAIGMALQGSLGHFAAGVMILAFKPYRIGDIVEINGKKGKVREIRIFNTIMVNPLNETIIIPNGVAISNVIVNFSAVGNIRVDLFARIPYEENFERVRQAILERANAHPKVLADPVASVGIEQFGSHAVEVGVFLFCKPNDYWDVYYDAHEIMKQALGKSGVKMAYAEGIGHGPINPE